jgi:hypothetical protein
MSMTFFSFYESTVEEEKRYYFMQGSTTGCSVNYSINVLNQAFEDRLISHILWPVRSSDLIPFDFYVWRNLRNKMYADNLHTFYGLKHNTYEAITSTEVSKLKLTSYTLFKRLGGCLRGERDTLSNYHDSEFFQTI